MKEFGDSERKIKYLLTPGTAFEHNKKNYTVIISDKPTCKSGEPKTDIYVLAKDKMGIEEEFKISYKKQNADFIENKMNSERAELLFGKDWKEIIINATKSIKPAFEHKKLIYKRKSGRTEKGAITLGWKFELLNKSGGELSGIIDLTRDQVIDVYAGTNISDEKKNAIVDGKIIENSGIANYLLMENDIETAQDIFDKIYSIEEYIDKYPKVYFACKALNYRTVANKWDGNRPLSVFVDWKVVDGKLTYDIVYDSPLITKGNEIANKLIDALNELMVDTTDDITNYNVADFDVVLE